MPSLVWKISEVPRPGQSLPGGGAVFKWSPKEHSSPRGDIPMPLKVNTKKETLVGTEEPTQMVMSSSLQPFTITGQWSDRWGGPDFARDEWKRFEAMVRRANNVRVDFDGISILALITDFTPVMRTRDVVPWTIILSPYGRGGEIGSTLARLGRSIHRGIAKLIKIARNSDHHVAVANVILGDLAEAQSNAARNTLAGDQWENVNSRLSSLTSVVDELDVGNADGALVSAREGVQSYRREISIHRRIRGRAQTLIDETANLRSDTGLLFDDAVKALSQEEWARTIRYSSRAAIFASWEAEQELDERARSKPAGRHVARKGESVYEISQAYYGTPSQWRQILDANNIFVFRFEGGEDLIIPASVRTA